MPPPTSTRRPRAPTLGALIALLSVAACADVLELDDFSGRQDAAGGASAVGGASAAGGTVASTATASGATSSGMTSTSSGRQPGCGPGAITDVQDDFEDSEIDPTTWSALQDPFTLPDESGGLLTLTFNPGSGPRRAGIETFGTYSLEGCVATVKLAMVPVSSLGIRMDFELLSSSNQRWTIELLAGELSAKMRMGTEVIHEASTKFEDSLHSHLRIGAQGGRAIFEASGDGANWTTLLDRPGDNATNTWRLRIAATASGDGVTGTVAFDDVNL